jgi:predicted Zn finger-like uncharacterized protein
MGGRAVTIEVQCTSCHTRYRIDEAVLPDGTPTFKCSRCGHVFNFEPRGAKRVDADAESSGSQRPEPSALNAELRSSRPGAVKRFSADTGAEIEPTTAELAIKRPEPPPPAARISAPAQPTPPQASPRPLASVASSPVAAATSKPSPMRPAAPPPAAHEEAEDDPMLRPLRRQPPTGELDEGENLAFNFDREADERERFEQGGDDDDRTHHELTDDSGGWEVGDPDAVLDDDDFAPPARPMRSPRRASRPTMPRFAAARSAKTRKTEQEEVLDAEFPDEAGVPVYNRRVTRSSRFFIGLFVLMAAGYAVMTMLIHSSPAVASELLSRLPVVGDRFVSPVTPARMVALRDVHSGYIRTRDGHTALLISGTAQNVGDNPLHTIQIDVSLRDPGKRGVASGAIYCGGDTLSPSMVAKMTPHELAFFQKLTPPKTFILQPSSSSPFVIVFIDPPSTVSAFDLSIAAAIPADATAPDSSSASGV